jgi:signal transduction histidine kinase
MSAPLDLNALAASSIHEVKNLLGQLTLSLEEIAQAQCPGTEQKIASARFACSRVVDRLTEMLILYKLDGGYLKPSIAAHSPTDFLEDVMLAAQNLTAGRVAIRIEPIEPGANAPAFWFFDRDLTESALMNAVHNALLHARSHITLSVAQDGDYLLFRISDDGPGYPTAVLQASLDAPRASQQGSGLGLFFASSVAQAHRNKERQGKVVLGNDAAGGALFSLYLP